MSSKPRSVNGLLTSVDSLFTTQAERDDELKPKVEEIALDLIDGFENHPFSVKDDEDMQNLVKSICNGSYKIAYMFYFFKSFYVFLPIITSLMYIFYATCTLHCLSLKKIIFFKFFSKKVLTTSAF